MLQKIKTLCKRIIDRLPGGNYIVFESEPDLSDNTKAVFDEMLRRGLNKKYRFIWWVKQVREDLPQYPNTYYLDTATKRNERLLSWVIFRAKCRICCNKFLTTSLQSRKSFYLTHGTALKKLNNYQVPERIQYTLVASEAVKEMMARELKGDISGFHALGYPRNDILHTANRDLHQLLDGEYRKVIVWYPTFRQHKGGMKTGAVNALPVLHDTQAAIRLNELAREKGVLIVVKPHFAQDIRYISDHHLSHIRFIDDGFFVRNHISSYEFVGSCDALITDYSSIYFDYLLCDKPVAVIWEDIEDYRKNPGFALDPQFYMQGAEKIYNLEDFAAFLTNVAEGRDELSRQRQKICGLVNYAADGQNSRRVVDFIVREANL